MSSSRTLAFVVSSLCLLAPFIAEADVTLEEKLSLEATGIFSMANMSGRTINTISADKARFESDLTMQSKLMRTFAKDAGKTLEIIRLDQDTVYNVDVPKRQYDSYTFAQMQAQREAAVKNAQEQQAKQGAASPVPIDESKCDWQEPKAEVKRTGESATVAGYNAERVAIVATQGCKDRATSQICEITFVIDQWLAPQFDAGEESARFYQAYATKMGVTTGVSKEMADRAETYFGRYKGLWEKVGKDLRDVKGHPVRSSFALGFGGPQCAASAQSAGATPVPTSTDVTNAATTAAGETAGEQAATSAGQPGLRGLAGALGGKVAKTLFGNKNSEPPPAVQAPAPVSNFAALAPAGTALVLRIDSELISVKRDAVPASTFEVPPGFTKKGT